MAFSQVLVLAVAICSFKPSLQQSCDVSCGGGPAVSLPFIGVPGPQGPPGNCGQKVAFSATRNAQFGPFTVATPVTWNNVITNVGNAFSESTGRFTAPVAGTYFFTVTIHKRGTLLAPFIRLVRDGTNIFYVDECCSTEDQYDTASNSVLLELTQGQQVWIELIQTRIMATNPGNNENMFSGFLLYYS